MQARATRHRTRIALSTAFAIAAASLAGCGGGGNAGIGGTVTGLGAGKSVTLQDIGTDKLTLSGNGAFQFPIALSAGSGYNVTVLTQPPGQLCEVANGVGVVDSIGDPVSGVAVECFTTSSLVGTVSGLAPGGALTLGDGTVLLPVAGNGAFAFPGVLIEGTPYQVSVATQPAGQTCTVANGTGAVVAASESAIAVTCS